MGTFVDPKATVEIKFKDPDGNDNTVWVRAKMDFRTQAAVQRDLLQMQVSTADAASGEVDEVTLRFSALGQKLAMLKHNIKRWRGPVFEDESGKLMPSTPEFVDRLDPDENKYWIDLVYDQVNDLNQPRTTDPNAERKKAAANGRSAEVADNPLSEPEKVT